jgi:hypothetical protein
MHLNKCTQLSELSAVAGDMDLHEVAGKELTGRRAVLSNGLRAEKHPPCAIPITKCGF